MEHTHVNLCELEPPRRNRYFYGKLLDADHFQLETDYHNAMRRLHNRLITGCGVVCGLNVVVADDPTAIVVTPGLAIDQHGREIVVDCPSDPQPIPADLLAAAAKNKDQRKIHVDLCYHECTAEPAPVLADECGELTACQPGVIRERYRLRFESGHVELSLPELEFGDLIGGSFDLPACHRDLVEPLSSTPCPPCPDDPCLPLANLTLEVKARKVRLSEDGIDVSIRPIVYNNALLFQLLLALIMERSDTGTRSEVR